MPRPVPVKTCRDIRDSVLLRLVLALQLVLTIQYPLAADSKQQASPIASASPLRKLEPLADKPEPAKSETKEKSSDEFPTLVRMEEITFGHANSGLSLDTRLNYLEGTIFRQTYPHLSPNQRAAKLQETLLGTIEDLHFPGEPPAKTDKKATAPENHETKPAPQPAAVVEPPQTEVQTPQPDKATLEAEKQPFYQAEISYEELKQFALDLVNDRREMQGLNALTLDEVAGKVAQNHAEDMAHRSVISHFSEAGENPDQRYTKAGGNDCLMETVSQLRDKGKINRLLVMLFMRDMFNRQDDRDALMSSDATGFAFACATNSAKTKSFSCCEVISRHGIMQPVPQDMKVGDKIDVKGIMLAPYHVERVTLAWEHPDPAAIVSADESEEALPYFPPLDYVAYAGKSEHDWSAGINALKVAGVVACIAGGMFIPPVALAAPAITMIGSGNPEPKPVSEIPVKGGIKVAGSMFSVHISINNEGKSGLYYLTVWATAPGTAKAVPISRRTIVASGVEVRETSETTEEKPVKKHHAR